MRRLVHSSPRDVSRKVFTLRLYLREVPYWQCPTTLYSDRYTPKADSLPQHSTTMAYIQQLPLKWLVLEKVRILCVGVLVIRALQSPAGGKAPELLETPI